MKSKVENGEVIGEFREKIVPYLLMRMEGLNSGKKRDIEKLEAFITNALNQQRELLLKEIRKYGAGGGYTALEVADILESEFLTKLEGKV